MDGTAQDGTWTDGTVRGRTGRDGTCMEGTGRYVDRRYVDGRGGMWTGLVGTELNTFSQRRAEGGHDKTSRD